MIANGFDVAVMEHHVSSSATGFSNTYSQARVLYYGISGIPNSFFDGITSVLGGSTGTYNSFLSKYNQRIAVPSNFTVAMNGMNEGLDYTVLINMEMVEPYTGTNLVAHLSLTQSGVMYGSTPFNYVTRRLWPSASGTAVDFSGDPNQTVMLQFTMDAGWNLDNCEFIAWIQDNSTKEILQAEKVAVNDLMPMFYDNATCFDLSMVPVTNCAGEVSPRVSITNEGASNLTTLEINYVINDEGINTFNWSGDLSYGEVEEVDLPAVPFEIMEDNNLMVYTTNPNGNPDEDPVNDTTYTSFTSAIEVIPDIHLYLKLDDNPEETTWELKNSAGDVMYSGGPYANPGLFVQETFALTEDDCYTFYIYDEGGNGIESPGFFKLMDGSFGMIYENNAFSTANESMQFAIDLVGIENPATNKSFNVYPNPFNDFTNVQFTLNEKSEVEVAMYNVIGKQVYHSDLQTLNAGQQNILIDASKLDSGIYFITLIKGGEISSQKVTLY